MNEGEMQCKHACRTCRLLSLSLELSLLPLCSFSHMSSWRSTAYTGVDECTHWPTCVHVQACLYLISSFSLRCMFFSSLVEFPSYFVTVLCPCGWCWVLLLLSLVYVCVCVSFLQARVKNEILDYKDLAALPKVKAIYEVQQPDLISSSYQPYHRYTSDDRLDTYSYGEVLLPHTPGQTQYWFQQVSF